MSDTLTSHLTHPESAWIAQAVPLCITIATILLLTLLLRGRLRVALHALLERRALRNRTGSVPAALLWTPPIADEGRLLVVCVLAALAVLLLLQLLAPLFLALVLAGPLTALLIWALLWGCEQRYRAQLDRALPAAAGRLGTQLRSTNGIQPALSKVAGELPPGPLRAEWTFLVAKLGTPLPGGSVATPQQVVAALAAQTPTPRHASFLGHLEVALGQTHDVVIARVQAAYHALHAAEQRRSQAATELAMMRGSGLLIGVAGVVITAFMALSNWTRFVTAYQGPLGTIVGAVFVLLLLTPVISGVLFAQADDFDY